MTEQRLYHSIAKEISKLIEQGDYPPGSRLPGERALAENFKVSRVTVREALISLQTLGLVQIRTGSGIYVCESGALKPAMLPQVSAFELTQARLLIESEAAALAAPDITDETLSDLASLIEKMETSDTEEEADVADRDFHLTIAAASENQVVTHIVEMFWKMRMEQESIAAAYHAVCSHDVSKRGEEHAEVLEALRARDAKASRLAMRKHFRRLMESMLDATEEQAIEEVKQRAAETRHRYLKGAI